jgi:hypothetical protein
MITIHPNADIASDKIRVTFTMPAAEDCCDALYLVGWFGEWNEAVYRMERAAGDTWSLTLELEPGCQYLFRYRTLDGKWLNDPGVPKDGTPVEPKNSFFLSARSETTAQLH